MENEQTHFIPMDLMIQVVEAHIMREKGVVVKIKPPANDKELQLLGRAYDYAANTTFTFSF